MISASDREEAVKLIIEAAEVGLSIPKACQELGITERTNYRWIKRRGTPEGCKDLRPSAAYKFWKERVLPHKSVIFLNSSFCGV